MASENEKKFSFGITGMTCASCAQIVETGIGRIGGVKFASVNLGTEKGYAITDESVSFDDIKKSVVKAGYGIMEKPASPDIIVTRFLSARKNLALALAAMIPLMLLMMFHMRGGHIPHFTLIEIIGGGFALFYAGRGILKGASIALLHFHTNMDTLVALGALSAWLTSLLALAGVNIISFGTVSSMLVALHLAGRYIESRLRFRASKDIRALLSIRADTANLLDGNEMLQVPSESVRAGAEIIVRTGERIPLDGTVFDGSGYADESMVTGEPMPVRKETGCGVISGTVLNSGVLKIRVTKTGGDTFLSQMIRLIEEAQSSKAPIQAFADRVTRFFIPVIVLIAAGMSIVWYFNYETMRSLLIFSAGYIPWVNPDAGAASAAVFVFVATLVIACPCALGLATPMALIAGTGRAARKGIIIRNGEAVQAARSLNVIILDKTGTITAGAPAVTGTDLNMELISAIASLEKNSAHPLAIAIVNYAREKSLELDHPFENIIEIAGSGITGTLNEKKFFAGRPAAPSLYKEITLCGKTAVEVSIDGERKGYIAVSDAVKPGARGAVDSLRAAGMLPVLLTGDSIDTANAVAREVGIDTVIAGVTPDGKVSAVRKYQTEGKIVAMVGDGINDAAALKSADVGIAIGTGTDLAIESADLVIIRGELSGVSEAIAISKATYAKIRQNLFWAFFYNLAAIPLAALGLLHPAIAEIAMTLSSVTVIVNSMRLRKVYHRGEQS